MITEKEERSRIVGWAERKIRELGMDVERIEDMHRSLEGLFGKYEEEFEDFVREMFGIELDVPIYPSFSLKDRGGGYLGPMVVVNYNSGDTSVEPYLRIMTHELLHWALEYGDEERIVEALNTMFWGRFR